MGVVVFRVLFGEKLKHVGKRWTTKGSFQTYVLQIRPFLEKIYILDNFMINVAHVCVPTFRWQHVHSLSVSEGSSVDDGVAQPSPRPNDSPCVGWIHFKPVQGNKVVLLHEKQSEGVGSEVI